MKHLKMIVVAAIAVGAMMALAGASSAAAAESTVLCKVKTDPCPAASVVGAGETIEASSTNATLTTNIATVVCTGSATSLNVSGITVVGGPETGTANSLSFTGCKTTSGTACTVTTQGFPANAALQKTAANTGTLTVTPKAAGNPGAKVVCGVLINCTFTTASAVLNVKGATETSALKANANAIVLERTGGVCPKTSTWTAEYTATAPNKGQLFVTS